MDSNLGKSCKLILDLIIAFAISIAVPVFFSPESETLSLVSQERLFLYALVFSLSYLFFGEVIGSRERNPQFGIAGIFLLPGISSFFAVLPLLLSVWVVEYSFIGRFAVGKIIICNALGSSLSLFCVNLFLSTHPTKCLLLLSSRRKKTIIDNIEKGSNIFRWVSTEEESDMTNSNVQKLCEDQKIDLLVIDESKSQNSLDIVGILSKGTQVIGLLEFWQRYLGCVPPSELNQAWLAKLDLRIRNPVAHKLKRAFDILFASVALVFCLPLMLLCFIGVTLESGFPFIFSQNRTGYLGNTFILHKIRTMCSDAEKDGARWAQSDDKRVTFLGKFLRKWRIDEIPQFWNVIKGDMSIVGPRPERPELQGDIQSKVPHWNTRHLVKPGITGWAQIKYQYASNMEASENKLAYDLYYLRNLSFALDLEIILATLRSIGKGSR